MVYFVGNKHTRDNLLRVEMPGLNEGEIFKKAVLRKSLNDVSRLKTIYPIGINNVEVNLNKAEQTIDLTLFFRERRRGRR
jgi:outer membrane protein assembly factor BamA